LGAQNFNDYKILLVEDEESLAAGLEFNLETEGYSVTRAENGRSALDVLHRVEIDLVILDIMLPFLNGFEVLEDIRKHSPSLPVLLLSARTAQQDKIKGLSLGADDYLTKPFHLEELLLRVEGMLRRTIWYRETLDRNTEYSFSGNRVDFKDLTCESRNGSFRLTPLEGALLKYFIDNENQIITREELLTRVWQIDSDTDTRTVDNFVMRLRKYFEDEPSKPVFFRNVRARGYIFNSEPF